MSLKRYYISGLHPHIWEHPEGEMVYFEDYVTLWAENARLKADAQLVVKHLGEACADNLRLKAEVERLRKAGDNMVHLWSSGKGTDLENFTEALWLWTTAKQPPTDLKSSAD